MNLFFPRANWKLVVAGFFAAVSASALAAAESIPVKNGERIAFLGDSITAAGAATPAGYVRLVISALEANGIKAEAVTAGVNGNTSKDMLARVDRDVIAKKPEWMTLSCGVNDVWHGANGCTLEEYKKNITELLDKVQAAGIKIVILTSTMIGEDQPNANNQKLIAYNDFLRSLAQERHYPVADLNAEMQAALATAGNEIKGNQLTVDGVHMNPAGNEMMATGVLKAFGFTQAELHKAHEKWLDLPAAAELTVKARVTLRQYETLAAKGKAARLTTDQLVAEKLSSVLQSEAAGQ